MKKRSGLREEAYQCLMTVDPALKTERVYTLYDRVFAGEIVAEPCVDVQQVEAPGRPRYPELLPPRKVKKRKLGTVRGRVALYHALAHIEFNAINLALDAAYRFDEMPDAFYSDWINVAKEEAYHFSLLNRHLKHLGAEYGDLPAHNGLWELCVETDFDVMVRMALVPRVMEARGLDVTPGLMQKLAQLGDQAAVDILAIIQRDEVGHVAIGNHWFKYMCDQRQLNVRETFSHLLHKHAKVAIIKGPFDEVSRMEAGFTRLEIEDLKALEEQFKQQMLALRQPSQAQATAM